MVWIFSLNVYPLFKFCTEGNISATKIFFGSYAIILSEVIFACLCIQHIVLGNKLFLEK